MAFEQQRDDINGDPEWVNIQIEHTRTFLQMTSERLEWAMSGMSTQVERTLTSTAYDLVQQAYGLVQQLDVLRGTGE